MKRIKIFSVCIFLILTASFIILFNSCEKKEGVDNHFKVTCILPYYYYSGNGCCSDSISKIEISIYYGEGSILKGSHLKTVYGINNSVIDCGVFFSGLYTIYLKCWYQYKVDHSSIGPCGNCNGGYYIYQKTVENFSISYSQPNRYTFE